MPLLPAGVTRYYERAQRFEELVRTLRKARTEAEVRAKERALAKRLHREGTPVILGNSAWFVVEAPEGSEHVQLVGDWNGWQPNADICERVNPKSRFFLLKKTFDYASRFAYRIMIDSNAAINDPRNPCVEREVFGENTVVRMPGYSLPRYAETPKPKVAPGRLREFEISSADKSVSGRRVTVYIPATVRRFRDLPVLYVHDGDEALHIARFRDVLDNLYHFEPHLPPAIVVFVPPVDRHGEYMLNLPFAKWFANELVPEVESRLRIEATGARRGVMGSSLGGLAAAYQGLVTMRTFGCIVAQSPSFWVEQESILKLYDKTKRLPLRWYLHTGRVHDAEKESRRMLEVLLEKGYSVTYRETEESHNWTNWKGKYAEIVRWFVTGAETKG